MRSIIVAVIIGCAVVTSAQAAIPLVNATCAGGIEVHADQGGPIYINGTEGKLHKFNDNYFEAKGSNVTISLTILPDGSADVSYTGQGGANGVCTLTDGSPASEEGCPADVSEADRGKYPACN